MEPLTERLSMQAYIAGYQSIDSWLAALEEGEIRQVKAKLYHVALTEDACKYLDILKITAYLRGCTLLALDPDEAFETFRDCYNPHVNEFMVLIEEI
ncbi:MAG: hypothetical protein KME59_21325 [Trichormus sp. ATA11-4-KO1]|jgi:hypothetical protein|nr:hypothetical protein [Trichormus sp. ATA11-4-KO1]